jgi:hypothetical protein
MRIATHYAYDTTVNNLQERQQKLSISQQQMTSGKRVNSASDDPPPPRVPSAPWPASPAATPTSAHSTPAAT